MINAGVLGLRRMPGNSELLQTSLDLIRKPSADASGGDQTALAETLKKLFAWDVAKGLDLVSMNTPWFFQQNSSPMEHYYGMATELRDLK